MAVVSRPFNSLGLVKHMRGEFFCEHVSQLHTYQTMVHRPPHGVYDYLTPGRLYTIYRKNFAWQYQPYYDGYEEGFSSTEELHRVMTQRDRTTSMDGFFFFMTKSQLVQLMDP